MEIYAKFGENNTKILINIEHTHIQIKGKVAYTYISNSEKPPKNRVLVTRFVEQHFVAGVLVMAIPLSHLSSESTRKVNFFFLQINSCCLNKMI